MKAALTDILLRSLKPPATGRLEIADIKCAGLEFRLTAGGVAIRRRVCRREAQSDAILNFRWPKHDKPGTR